MSAAVVSALKTLARSAPVVVAIDDVHWLDIPSARALEFAARRLGALPIGLLVSVKDLLRENTALTQEVKRNTDLLEEIHRHVAPMSPQESRFPPGDEPPSSS